ncbi:MAG: insulinase family protein [Magnetococcus sp. DMHC-8]
MTKPGSDRPAARWPDGRVWVRLLGVVLLCLGSWRAEGLEHQDFTLNNGLRVILVREPKAPVAISQVWYRVGSVDEVEGKTGLSHMLEHMMFQGTPAVPAGEFHRLVGRNGGENNASTTHDATSYYIKLAADRIELALRLEADRMRHLSLQEEHFRSENQVVQEERRSRTDADPNGRFLEKFQARAYGSHPYGRPVIGWMTDIQHYTVADLRAWYQRHYAPNNAVLVLVGDLDLAAMAQHVRDHFADLPARPDLPQTLVSPYRPPPLPAADEPVGLLELSASQRLAVTDPGVTLPMWYGGYPVPTLLSEGREDVFALDVLATILGSGSNSRLYQKLVLEEGLAVSVSAHYGGFSRSWELFTLSATPKSPGGPPAPSLAASPEGNGEPTLVSRPDGAATGVTGAAALPRIEQAILHEIDRLAREPVSERELQRAKNGMIARHVFAHDSIHELASAIGLLSANGIDWLSVVEELPQKIEAVRAEDVQRVAARYLRPGHLVVGVLTP